MTYSPESTSLNSGEYVNAKRVESLAPRITEVTHELLEQMKQHEQVDLVQAFSTPLPIVVIAEILGVPHQD